MWLHKAYETGKNTKSKDYNKGMSQIINLTLQLKQLDKHKKHTKYHVWPLFALWFKQINFFKKNIQNTKLVFRKKNFRG